MTSLRVIGPMLSICADRKLSIIICLVDIAQAPKKLWCRVVDSAGAVHVRGAEPSEDNDFVALFSFENVPSGQMKYGLFYDESCEHSFVEDNIKPSYQTKIWSEFELQHDYKFVASSCFNPTRSKKGLYHGFRMARVLARKAANDPLIAFHARLGDQWYGDDIFEKLVAEKDLKKRAWILRDNIYKYYCDPTFRTLMATLPAVNQIDDHDQRDGFMSDTIFFPKHKRFTEIQPAIASTARSIHLLQYSTNIGKLNTSANDFGFQYGRYAFILPDFRSNRDPDKNQVFLPDQLAAYQDFINSVREKVDVIFFCPGTVFAHGAPNFDNAVEFLYLPVNACIRWLSKKFKWNWLQKLSKWVDDFQPRDDIKDSLGHPCNAVPAEQLLNLLFDTQNGADGKRAVPVTVISGDIHCAGTSLLYSKDPRHIQRSSILQIVASPLGYEPFPALLESIYRMLTKKNVTLGSTGKFVANIDTHYSQRNFAVLGVENNGESLLLKTQFFLEGSELPLTVTHDLLNPPKYEDIVYDDKEAKPDVFDSPKPITLGLPKVG